MRASTNGGWRRRWAPLALAALVVTAAACGDADARLGQQASTSAPATTATATTMPASSVPASTAAPITRPTSGTLPLPATTVPPVSTLPAADTSGIAPTETTVAGPPSTEGPATASTPAPAPAGGGTTRTTKPPAAPAAPKPAATTATPVAGKAFGTIEIPRLGLNVPLLSGITDTVLDRGPGHWPGTALPGQVGNVVVAGHRVSHTRPFRYIDQLQIGDEIIYTTAAGRFRYRVSETFIVTPQQVEIVRQSDAYETTLFACHPPGSIKYRYVVRAVLAP